MPKIVLFQRDGTKVGEFHVNEAVEIGDTLRIGEAQPFSAYITRIDESKNPIEVFSNNIVVCPLCNNTGLQKVGETKSTVRPCPNGCKSDQSLSHPSDAEHPDHCNLCNDTGVTATGPCFCKFAQQLQSGR